MSDEVTNTTVSSVKETSDGFVKISVEKYNDLLEKVADQNGRIGTLREQLNEARNKPPVINRTIINKTAEMVSEEHRVWGYTFMGTGAILFGIGAYRFKKS